MKRKSVVSVHQRDQQKRWEDFKKKLQGLKEDKSLGITNKEISEGLSVSRQSLYDFMSGKKKDLNIQRYNILDLWDAIVSSENDLISQIEARKQLKSRRKHVLDELLKSAGFLPASTVDTTPHIERITSRLSGPWITNKTILSNLTGAIIDTILDKGGFDKNNGATSEREGLSLNQARKVAKGYFRQEDWEQIKETCIREIDRFVTLGKVFFYPGELYELCQSILENHNLRRYPGEMQAIGCEFRTVSFNLTEDIEDEELVRLCDECEKDLRPQLESSHQHIFPPVIEASARFKVGAGRSLNNTENNLDEEEVLFRYTCCGTHVEAALMALSNGAGYPLISSLSLSTFFIKAIGEKSESLARVSVTLTEMESETDESNIYQGLWVDQNIFLGVLKSTNYAILNWLSHHLEKELINEFYSIFKKASFIKEALHNGIEKVYNYRSFSHINEISSKNNYLHTKEEENLNIISKKVFRLSEEIDALYQKYYVKNNRARISISNYFEFYKKKLDQKLFLAGLSKARIRLFECDLIGAKELLKDLENKLFIGESVKSSDKSLKPIAILYKAETMLLQTLAGDPHFLNENTLHGIFLEEDAKNTLKDLKDFAIENSTGIIDCESYLSAGQYFGILGLARFYWCPPKDEYRKDLENATEFFIKASHLSARIGHRQRAFRCMFYASRVFCRTNNEKRAILINDIADKILENEKGSRPNSYTSQSYLSKGEILLNFPGTNNIEESYLKALTYFLIAWKKAHIHKFERTKIGSCYNICRTIEELKGIKSIKKNEDIKKLLSRFKDNQDKENRQTSYDIADIKNKIGEDNKKNIFNTIFYHLIKQVRKELKLESEIDSMDINDTQESLDLYVIDTLNSWNSDIYPDSKEHPLSEKIRDKSFLKKIN